MADKPRLILYPSRSVPGFDEGIAVRSSYIHFLLFDVKRHLELSFDGLSILSCLFALSSYHDSPLRKFPTISTSSLQNGLEYSRPREPSLCLQAVPATRPFSELQQV